LNVKCMCRFSSIELGQLQAKLQAVLYVSVMSSPNPRVLVTWLVLNK